MYFMVIHHSGIFWVTFETDPKPGYVKCTIIIIIIIFKWNYYCRGVLNLKPYYNGFYIGVRTSLISRFVSIISISKSSKDEDCKAKGCLMKRLQNIKAN
jgi:hypothetical protein